MEPAWEPDTVLYTIWGFALVETWCSHVLLKGQRDRRPSLKLPQVGQRADRRMSSVPSGGLGG